MNTIVKVRYSEEPTEKTYSYLWKEELGEPIENIKVKVTVRDREKSAWISSFETVDDDYLNALPYQLKSVINVCEETSETEGAE